MNNSWKITEKGVAAFGSNIAGHLTRLQNLTWDFTACEQISDEALAVLASKVLPQLTHIQTLRLDFQRYILFHVLKGSFKKKRTLVFFQYINIQVI